MVKMNKMWLLALLGATTLNISAQQVSSFLFSGKVKDAKEKVSLVWLSTMA